jgi:hypothetical protein
MRYGGHVVQWQPIPAAFLFQMPELRGLSSASEHVSMRLPGQGVHARRTTSLFPPLYKNGVEGVVTQLRSSTSHILMWGVREQEGHPLYPITALP